MRERRFKRDLADRVLADPAPRSIVDLGCGTGTLTVELARRAPEGASVTGLDGDVEVIARAREKAERAGVAVDWVQGFADVLPFGKRSVDRVVSSLLFHHLQPESKRRALSEARRVLRPGGRLHIADWGRPRDPLMRIAFLGIQLLDGFSNTRDHAAGRLPEMIEAAGFSNVTAWERLRTPYGTLELIDAERR